MSDTSTPSPEAPAAICLPHSDAIAPDIFSSPTVVSFSSSFQLPGGRRPSVSALTRRGAGRVPTSKGRKRRRGNISSADTYKFKSGYIASSSTSFQKSGPSASPGGDVGLSDPPVEIVKGFDDEAMLVHPLSKLMEGQSGDGGDAVETYPDASSQSSKNWLGNNSFESALSPDTSFEWKTDATAVPVSFLRRSRALKKLSMKKKPIAGISSSQSPSGRSNAAAKLFPSSEIKASRRLISRKLNISESKLSFQSPGNAFSHKISYTPGPSSNPGGYYDPCVSDESMESPGASLSMPNQLFSYTGTNPQTKEMIRAALELSSSIQRIEERIFHIETHYVFSDGSELQQAQSPSDSRNATAPKRSNCDSSSKLGFTKFRFSSRTPFSLTSVTSPANAANADAIANSRGKRMSRPSMNSYLNKGNGVGRSPLFVDSKRFPNVSSAFPVGTEKTRSRGRPNTTYLGRGSSHSLAARSIRSNVKLENRQTLDGGSVKSKIVPRIAQKKSMYLSNMSGSTTQNPVDFLSGTKARPSANFASSTRRSRRSVSCLRGRQRITAAYTSDRKNSVYRLPQFSNRLSADKKRILASIETYVPPVVGNQE